jgi:hypothetical protein
LHIIAYFLPLNLVDNRDWFLIIHPEVANGNSPIRPKTALHITKRRIIMVKPIETIHNGYRFRSRLEARWAVFFDKLGIKYYYERQGYDLGKVGWYLPDFWLPHYADPDIDDGKTGVFVEIKPTKATEYEYSRGFVLAEQTGMNVFIFQGEPYPNEYSVTQIQFWDLGRLEPPIIMHNLQFQAYIDVRPIEGYPDHPWIDKGIALKNTEGKAGGFVVLPLFDLTEKDLNNAYLSARQARFQN